MNITDQRKARASAIAAAGGLEEAIAAEVLSPHPDLTLSEALVLGLMRQGVTRYVGVFGHGSTDLGEVLRVYEDAGLVRTWAVRHETEAAHAATALRWVTGEQVAVVTSIGPGAMHAFAGSLASASDGLGVWHLYGDETTEDEGPNMQQIPKHEQGLFARLFGTLGDAYSLHTPQALPAALGRGQTTVNHPWRQGPFFLLLPMNVQPAVMEGFNLDSLPARKQLEAGPAADGPALVAATVAVGAARRIVVKVGFGARHAGEAIVRFLERTGAVAVHTPIATGVVPASHPQNMGVGGSKGSICGNHAMEHADLVVAVGTRFVCQSDSSRTGYPEARRVITINPDPHTANHYSRNIALVGDTAATLDDLCRRLDEMDLWTDAGHWLTECAARQDEWRAWRQARYDRPTLHDPIWAREVLTQPAAIKAALYWARANDAVSFFDAGDVQANGFQIAEDEVPGRTVTETGASYMGFAASALLATAITDRPFYGLAFTGDGSFTMNPQILIDGAVHGATGCILLLDNRRMAAISSLQEAQYGADYATWDHLKVDYVKWADAVTGVKGFFGGHDVRSLVAALDKARAHPGLSLVHVPVYYGPHPLGGLGAFGRWNVGSWVRDVQRLRQDIGL